MGHTFHIPAVLLHRAKCRLHHRLSWPSRDRENRGRHGIPCSSNVDSSVVSLIGRQWRLFRHSSHATKDRTTRHARQEILSKYLASLISFLRYRRAHTVRRQLLLFGQSMGSRFNNAYQTVVCVCDDSPESSAVVKANITDC